MASFCCSIELEPRTLNEGQLNHAREVAADIMQNKEPIQASTLFAAGLKPVVLMMEEEEEEVVVIQKDAYPPEAVEDQLLQDMKTTNKVINVIETSCQCSCSSSVMDSPSDQATIKEPLSAPF